MQVQVIERPVEGASRPKMSLYEAKLFYHEACCEGRIATHTTIILDFDGKATAHQVTYCEKCGYVAERLIAREDNNGKNI